MRYLLNSIGPLVGLLVTVILFDLMKMIFQSISSQMVRLFDQAIDDLPGSLAWVGQTLKQRSVYHQAYPEVDDWENVPQFQMKGDEGDVLGCITHLGGVGELGRDRHLPTDLRQSADCPGEERGLCDRGDCRDGITLDFCFGRITLPKSQER